MSDSIGVQTVSEGPDFLTETQKDKLSSDFKRFAYLGCLKVMRQRFTLLAQLQAMT